MNVDAIAQIAHIDGGPGRTKWTARQVLLQHHVADAGASLRSYERFPPGAVFFLDFGFGVAFEARGLGGVSSIRLSAASRTRSASF